MFDYDKEKLLQHCEPKIDPAWVDELDLNVNFTTLFDAALVRALLHLFPTSDKTDLKEWFRLYNDDQGDPMERWKILRYNFDGYFVGSKFEIPVNDHKYWAAWVRFWLTECRAEFDKAKIKQLLNDYNEDIDDYIETVKKSDRPLTLLDFDKRHLIAHCKPTIDPIWVTMLDGYNGDNTLLDAALVRALLHLFPNSTRKNLKSWFDKYNNDDAVYDKRWDMLTDNLNGYFVEKTFEIPVNDHKYWASWTKFWLTKWKFDRARIQHLLHEYNQNIDDYNEDIDFESVSKK